MSRGARILLVDDLPQNLEILSGLLEPEGYALELAQDGEQAVEMALARPPDLILMDVSMPTVDGIEAVFATFAWARWKRRDGVMARCLQQPGGLAQRSQSLAAWAMEANWRLPAPDVLLD